PSSLLAWITLLVERYRECPVLAWGRCRVLDHDTPAVFALHADDPDAAGRDVVTLHNLGSTPVRVVLSMPVPAPATLTDLLGGTEVEVDRDGRLVVEMEGYGSMWLR
ncbi:MAG: trehalose synthase, partial [Pseudonocardia sp.]|nr:trehalose synthase [Pseudonocardia sp.]